MKKIILFTVLTLFLFSCSSILKDANSGSFRIVNNSDKVIEFVWLTPEGTFYPVAHSISVKKGEVYEVGALKAGTYDIAIDFKDEYNSFNSKKDKSLCLKVERGFTKVWVVDKDGNIIRN